MQQRRWLHIIPVALIMYTISYVDRTNISLALDPKISKMMGDLLMDDELKGRAAGIFFVGYMMLQIPGGHLARAWSAKRLVAILLVLWGLAAAACGLVHSFRQFEVVRFLLGVAESGVYPATLVLLAGWFPKAERARANAYWHLCMPLAVAGSAPVTGWLLQQWGWRTTLVLEGALPFVWLPIWLYFINDHPRQAKWISAEERTYLETALQQEAAKLEPAGEVSFLRAFFQPVVGVMVVIYFCQNCAAYGCMFFLTSALDAKDKAFGGLAKGILFGIPYVVAAFMMILNSWHSDKTQERRGHVALAYGISGACLIGSVFASQFSYWISYGLLCFAVAGPFASLAPFWAIPTETFPRNAMGAIMGLVNAIGNLGGFLGPAIVGWLKMQTHDIVIPFGVLGLALLLGASLTVFLPKSQTEAPPTPV